MTQIHSAASLGQREVAGSVWEWPASEKSVWDKGAKVSAFWGRVPIAQSCPNHRQSHPDFNSLVVQTGKLRSQKEETCLGSCSWLVVLVEQGLGFQSQSGLHPSKLLHFSGKRGQSGLL